MQKWHIHKHILSWGLLIGVLLLPTQSFAKDQIIWRISMFPPWTITEGPFKGEGWMDDATRLIQDKMPNYQHKFINAPIARFIRSVKAGKPMCFASTLKKPERKEYLHFSLPAGISLANALVVRKDKLQKFGNPTESISFETVLQNPSLRGGILTGRSHGTGIDPLLQKYPDANIDYFSIDHENQFRMLLADRLDYVLEFPTSVSYLEKSLEKEGHAATLTIQEQDPYILSHVACTKNEWGKKVIDQIDQVLLVERPTALYRSYMEKWRDPNSVRLIRKGYDTVFLQAK